MKAGDIIWVRVYKADGALYRSWQTLVESADDHCIVTYTEAFQPLYQVTQTFTLQHHFRTYFWSGRRHTLLEVYEPDGRLAELYADITSPIEVVDGEVHFIDHELDVIQYTGQEARIIDQDEFAEAAERFGYKAEFVRESYALAESLVGVLANWRPLGIQKPGFFRETGFL